MPLPPKSRKKKKRKKAGKGLDLASVSTPGEEPASSESDVSEDDQEAEDAIDKAISKKYPDYKVAVQIIEDLRKTFPQTNLNGERNIWIIKPAQSSRGRGIILLNSLV